MVEYWSFKHPKDRAVEVLVGRERGNHGVIIHKGGKELVSVMAGISKPGRIYFPFARGRSPAEDVVLELHAAAPPKLLVLGQAGEVASTAQRKSASYARSVQTRLIRALKELNKTPVSLRRQGSLADYELVSRAFKMPERMFGQAVFRKRLQPKRYSPTGFSRTARYR